MEPIEPVTFKQLMTHEGIKNIKKQIWSWGIRGIIYKGVDMAVVMNIYGFKIRDLLNISAVYFLSDHKNIVYIGQTTNLHRRITQHTDKIFDDFYYFEIDEIHLKLVEDYYITAMNPKYNKTHEKKIDVNKKLLWLEEKRKLIK